MIGDRNHPSRIGYALLLVAIGFLVSGCSPADNTPAIYASLANSGEQLDVDEARNLINSYRRENGLENLQIDARLMTEAKSHARDMAAHDKVGHRVSTRGNFAKRMNEAGLGDIKAAENVGAGYHTVAQAFSGWRGSSAHNENMLLPEARLMGISAIFAPHSKYKVFWVLIVSSDQNTQ